jgi:S-adenosylmethionine:tRNA ribosyltransferase-isomerase
MLRTSDYDYSLPAELIAQAPLARRDDSRLMVLRRATGEIEHREFRDLLDLVGAGDLLVRNTTKVFRARLLGSRDSGAPAEVFLLKDLGDGRWEAMVSPGGKLHPPRVVHIAPGFDAQIVEITERRTRIVQLTAAGDLAAAIEQHGHVPLPPYIDRSDESADVDRYQTVYANQSGSVAAPTAGLHFTPELLRSIESHGARIADLTLHVGAGTFKPVDVDLVADHVMHEEWYDVPSETANAVNATHVAGRSVWAVGTTSLRALESALTPGSNAVRPGTGETRIFIHPPYIVRSVHRLITNFHLPRSTLLMLVAAFAGHDLMKQAYEAAVRERYRFYSYGDAMVIL